MLFNSLEFLFVFLPLCLLGYFLCARYIGVAGALTWLAGASIAFYAYWNPSFLSILATSIVFNYVVAGAISGNKPGHRFRNRRGLLLGLGIAGNLAALLYYKYWNFFIHTLNRILGSDVQMLEIVLPLGISFFTFTQIAFLIDVYRREAKEYSFLRYVLFVSYFPHLIAGPIIHHKEMMPQFGEDATMRPNRLFFSVGITIFSIGLFKKVIFADGMGRIADPVFDAATTIAVLPVDAWGAIFAYTLQIYFDFSGYSDMAIGLSYMLGIRLPVNFYSPYKSTSIIEFWRRWHMTLSRFLRDYLYFPLGGNRKGPTRRHLNLFLTMILGGIWHGAGSTFIIWGALHGLYLTVNHAWRSIRVRMLPQSSSESQLRAMLSIVLTFLCVSFAWIFFRASDLDTSFTIVQALTHMPRPEGTLVSLRNVNGLNLIEVAILCVVAFAAPNSLQIMRRYRPALAVSADIWRDRPRLLVWSTNAIWGGITAVIGAICVAAIFLVGDHSQFLYFQF